MEIKKTNIFLATVPVPTAAQKMHMILEQCQEKLSSRYKIKWTHPSDLHITIGYIRNILVSDIKRVVDMMSIATLHQSFSVTLGDLRLYGNALAFKIAPIEPLRDIHVRLNAQLEHLTQNRYHFDHKGRFEPHLTIARLQNNRPLPPPAKHVLFSLVKTPFHRFEFLINQVAVMQSNPQENGARYSILRRYPFSHG